MKNTEEQTSSVENSLRQFGEQRKGRGKHKFEKLGLISCETFSKEKFTGFPRPSQ